MPMRTQVLAATILVAAAGWNAGRGTQAQDLEHGVTPADLERGGQLFMSTCTACHGPDGDLVANVDLGSGSFRRASTDQELVTLIRAGIPGTPMPPNALSEADATRIVAYLRSLPALRRVVGPAGVRGNAARGKALVEGKAGCLECHIVNGTGGFLGPDLSSVGVTRREDELQRALTDPSADIRTGNRAAIVVRRDGTRVTGRLLNHDTYSIQLIDARGTLLSLDKAAVADQAVVTDTHALIFHAAGSGSLGAKARARFAAAEAGSCLIYVPVAVIWEVTLLARAVRINLHRPVPTFFRELFSNPAYQPHDLTAAQVFDADELRFTRDPFDALIVAAARDLDLPLLTRDTMIRESGHVRVVW